MKIVLVGVPMMNSRVPPLSLALLAAQMRKDGYQVKTFDFNIETYHKVVPELKDQWTFYKGMQWMDNSYFENFVYPNVIGKNLPFWIEKILNENPDVIGISVTSHPSARILAEKLKLLRPEVKIVIGGPVCSKSFDHKAYFPNEIYDAVVHNEGELTLSELMKEFVRTGKMQPVLGASVLGENGEIVYPGLREAVMDLDQMVTPDFDDFDFALYVDADSPDRKAREIPYYTTRGCPARCNFCMDYKMWDSRYRQKSPARIIEEMIFLSERYKIKDFMLIELIFNGHMEKLRTFVRDLASRNLGFKFWGHGRIDPRLDIETIQLLKDAGFHWFVFGLESGSDKVLKAMRKGYDVAIADRVLTNMQTVGLTCSVNVIVGFPGESWDDYLQTIKFIYKHRKTIGLPPSLCSCNVMPGSDIFLYPDKFGIKHLPGHPPPVIEWESVDGENTNEVREFRKEFMRDYFFKFRWKFDPEDKQDFDIETMPDPYQEFLKAKGRKALEAAETNVNLEKDAFATQASKKVKKTKQLKA